MKLVLKTEGLTGENLEFVKQLNLKFAELPDAFGADEVRKEIQLLCKGLFTEKGDMTVDFAKLAALEEKTFGEGENSLFSILKHQGAVITAMKELRGSEPARVKSVRDQIKEFHEANKDKLAAFLSGESKSFGTSLDPQSKEMVAGISIKAAVTMGVTASSNGSAFVPNVEVVPGLVDLNRNRPFIEQYANVSSTNRSRIVWAEKTNPQGQAGWLAEGGLKPLISFEWTTRESYAKKVADKIKVSTEALQDVDWLAAEIEAELKYQIDIAVDVALLSGTGDGSSANVNLKGITQYAPGFVLTNVKTTMPNNFDAGRAMYAQISNLNFTPTHWFINTLDAANMDLVKDTQGRPLVMDYRDNTGRIFRVIPIETNQIPVGYTLMADMSKFKVRNYIPFAIYYGWVNDDFEKNLVTVIGERRLHDYIATNDLGAFIYDSFANIKTAITAA